MATNGGQGSVTGKIILRVDKKSWDNLELFQKKMNAVKDQMNGLGKAIKLGAVTSSIDRAQKAVGRGTLQNKQKEYNAHVALFQKHQNKMEAVANQKATTVNVAKKSVTNRLAGLPPSARSAMFKEGGIFDRLSANYMNTSMSATEFRKSVSSATTALIRQEAAAKRAVPSMRSLRGELVQATAAFTAFSTGVNIFQTGKEFDSMQASMTLFAGNASGVKETMSFIRNESERLGINFQEAAANFTKFAIVARNKMSQQQTRELFSGFSEYATVLQVDQYRFSRGMLALQQMMSKSKISMEELKNQLSENIPGSIQVFSDALGMSEAEMFKQMETGKLLAEDVLPKVAKEYSRVARQNGALEKAQEKVNSQYQRFLNALTEAKMAIFEGGFGEAMATVFKDSAGYIQSMLPELKAFGAFIGGFMKGLYNMARLIVFPFRMLSDIFTSIFGPKGSELAGIAIAAGLVAGKMWSIAKAIGVVRLSFLSLIGSVTRFWLPLTALLAAEDIYVNAKGGNSTSGRMGLGQNAAQGMVQRVQDAAMYGPLGALVAPMVRVVFDSDEAKKFVRIETENVTANQQANLAASIGN